MNFKLAWKIHNTLKENKKNSLDDPSFPKSGWIFPCILCLNPTSQKLTYDKNYENVCNKCNPILKDYIRWKSNQK